MSNERGVTRRGIFGLFLVILLVSAGVFAESVSQGAVSSDVEKYLESFVNKGGIDKENIKDIKEVDLNDLPDEIEIQEIVDNYIDIYELNYSTDQGDKKLFIVTYSTEEFKERVIAKIINYLDFGYAGSSSDSGYLKTSAGVVSGEDNGYVMMRSGSITGVSTSLSLQGNGAVIIKIYKNGKDTGFENRVSTSDKKQIDYDLQSEDIVIYEAGDVIAVYIEAVGDVTWSDAVTQVETTTN